MNNLLISLRSRSYEAEVILKNFASRKRVHKDKEVQVHRLYLDMTNRGLRLNRAKFDQVFVELERLNYGITLGKDAEGRISTFMPETSIKSIGMDAMEVLKPIAEVVEVKAAQVPPAPTTKLALVEPKVTGLVKVVIIRDGMRWEATVPEDRVAEVTAKMA